MKPATKKVPVYLKLDAILNNELRERSRITGIPQIRILEDALEQYFAGGQQKDLVARASELAKRKTLTFTR